MTVKLLKPYGWRPAGAITSTLDASTESGLIAAGKATADLTGGTLYFRKKPGVAVQPKVVAVGAISLKMEEQATCELPEGQVLKVTGGVGAVGEATRTGSADRWNISTGALPPIGPFSGTQKVVITCLAGGIDAVVADAVLSVAQSNNQAPNTVVVQNPFSGATAAIAKPGNFECGGGLLGGAPNSGATGNSTWCHAFSAWGPFSRAKLVFANSSGSQQTVDALSVAASTTIYPAGVNNIAQPQGGGTFAAAQTALAVPSGPSARVPAYTSSAWFDCRSLPRAAGELDNGIYELLLARAYWNTGGQFFSLNAAMAGVGWDSINEGFTQQYARAPSGDKVTVPGSLTTLTREATNPIVTVHGVIFDYDQKMFSILTPGDSIWDGALDGVTNRCPFTFKAIARVRKTGKMVSYINGGISSSTAAEINTRGKALIDAYAPELIVIAAYTVNSPTATQADWDAQWLLFKDLAKYQLSKGKQIMFVTPLPNNNFTTTQNGYRRAQRQRVINSGLPYADIEAATVDVAGGQGRWLPGLAADQTHPSPAGHEAMAAVLQPVIAALAP